MHNGGDTTLKFGIVGTGHRTATTLLPASRQLSDASLTAICDISEPAMNGLKMGSGVGQYTDFHSMLSKEKLDFIIAATPHDVYRGIIEAAAEKGVHVLKEKPFAVSIREGIYFEELARNRIHVATLLQRRTIPTYTHFFTLKGQIGEPFFVESKYAKFIEKPYGGWRGDRDKIGGGVIVDMGYHIIDLLVWYFGLPDSVYAVYTSRAAPNVDYRAEDTASVLFGYGSGLRGSLFVSKYYSPKTEYVRIVGSEGTITLDGSGATLSKPDGRVTGFLQNEAREVDAVRSQIEAFCRVVRGEAKNSSDSSYNLQHVAFVEACYGSQEIGYRSCDGVYPQIQAHSRYREP